MERCRAPLTLLVLLFASAAVAQHTDRDFLVTHDSEVICAGCDPRYPGTLLRIKGRGVVTSITPTDNTWVISISGKLDHQPLMCNFTDPKFDGKVGDTVIVEGDDAWGSAEKQRVKDNFPGVTFDCSLRNISDPNLHGIAREDFDPLCQQSFIKPGTDLFTYCRTIVKK